LDQKVRNNAPDHELMELLYKLKECCDKINNIGQCHLELLLSMDTAQQLAIAGFFGEERAQVEVPQSPESMTIFVKKLLAEVQTLSEEQKGRINAFLENHYEKLEEIREVRNQLNQELAGYFASQNAAPSKQNFSSTFSVLASLEQLRQNLAAESFQYEDAMEKIMLVLTPLQAAQFYLRIEFQHGAVLQLKAVWETLTKHP